MNLIALDIPAEPSEQAGWLEGHLVGLDLGCLVAELSACHGTPPGAYAATSLQEVLGDRQESVLSQGLGALPPDALRQLLVVPGLLLDLQALIAAEGGPYWEQLRKPTAAARESLERGRQQLRSYLADEGKSRPEAVVLAPRPARWYARPWAVSFATAAAVLLGIFAFQRLGPEAGPKPAPGWGWSKPGAMPKEDSPAAYLDGLANAADDWFKEQPKDAVAVARRIGEFRKGCSVLLLSEHTPLSAEDRQWLKEKCQLWAGKLDKHLAALESGKDAAEVLNEANATVKALMDALHNRATLRRGA